LCLINKRFAFQLKFYTTHLSAVNSKIVQIYEMNSGQC